MAEQFTINIVTTGAGQTEASAKKVSGSFKEMSAAAKAASAESGAAAATMSKRWEAAGASMTATGKSLNRHVTLPLLAVGGIAAKMSLDFGRSMTEISTQAGASAREVKRMSSAILELSSNGRFAQGPQDLAKAIFDIESVGYRGAKALRTLKAASDLATVGNADLESTTSALVGVMKTGIKGAGSMHSAIGTLNATIGAGKMHMEDLNAAIGTGFTGSAKGLGISLKGLGAALAELTSQGVPANSAATRLRMTMSLLANPTTKAAKLLDSIGIGSQDLARKMRQSGSLIPALQELQDKMKEAGLTAVQQNQLLAQAFGGAKSGGTIVQLLGQLGDLSVKEKQIAQNTGDFNKKLAETNAEPAVKLAKAWSAVQAEMIKLGAVLLPEVVPALQKVGGIVTGLVHGFTALPGPAKETVLELLAVAAVAGPILRLGGAFASLGAKVIGASQAIAGTSLMGDLGSAFSLARGGEMGGFAMIGKDISGSIIRGLTKALPVAAAAAGLGNIIYSATQGDWKQAGFKAGGALVGGIAGAFIGGPAGAMIGAGAGSFLGGLLGDLFTSEKKLSPLQARLRAETMHAAEAMRAQHSAAEGLAKAQDKVAAANRRHRASTHNVTEAHQQLNHAVKQFGPNSVQATAAELRLMRAQRKDAKSAREARNAHRLAGDELALYKHKTVIAVASEKQRIPLIQQQVAALRRQHNEHKGNYDILAKLVNREKALSKAQGNLNQLYADAQSKAGPRFVAGIKAMTGAQAEYGNHMKGLIKQLPVFGQQTKQWLSIGGGEWMDYRGTVHTSTQRATQDMLSMTGTTRSGLMHIQGWMQNALKAMGANSQSFHLSGGGGGGGGKGHARGGITRVRGAGLQDTVSLTGGGINAMVAPGEDVIVANRHQRPMLDEAVSGWFGVRGLDGFFNSYDRPHHMARGGIMSFSEPRIVGPAGPLRAVGQGELDSVYRATRAYVRRQGGDRTYQAVVKNANRMDALHQPYVWGGGHGATASVNGPWDCSGATSELYNGAGWHFAPMVSTGFESFGSAGKGRVSILANAEHVYSVVGGKAFGTSASNPGGGAGWISGYTYRPGFTVRHVDLFGEGAPTASRRGKGQHQAKGFASGGFVRVGATIDPTQGQAPTYSAHGGMSFAELLQAGTNRGLHPTLTEVLGLHGATYGMAMETPIKIRKPGGGRTFTIYKNDVGSGQAGDPHYKIDLHSAIARAVGVSGKGDVEVSSSGSAAAGSTAIPKHLGHGSHMVSTGTLSFGSLPSTIYRCRKELALRRDQLHKYLALLHHIKDTKERAALQRNITALRKRIDQLIAQKARLVEKRRRQRVVRKIARRAQFTGWVDRLTKREQAYNIASQHADQIQTLEPTDLTSTYLDQENTAFGTELASELNWRNTILGAEGAVTSTIGSMNAQIGAIERLRRKHPAAYKRERFRIPALKQAIRTAREFYNPSLRTGTFEDALTNVQGYGAPRGILSALPPMTGQPNGFGGLIFDTQDAAYQLGLRSTASASESQTEINDLLKQQIAQLQHALAVANAQAPILANYLGAYKTGGKLPADGFYYGHKDETVVPADSGPLHETHVHISGDMAPFIDARVEHRLTQAGRRVGLGRGTPSAAGQRASMSQGRMG